MGVAAAPAGFRQWLAGSEDDRANPVALEVLLFLLGADFFWREGWKRLVQQVQFEFGDRQEQRLRRFDLGFCHVASALADDVVQQFGAEGWFNGFIEGDGLVAARRGCVFT